MRFFSIKRETIKLVYPGLTQSTTSVFICFLGRPFVLVHRYALMEKKVRAQTIGVLDELEGKGLCSVPKLRGDYFDTTIKKFIKIR